MSIQIEKIKNLELTESDFDMIVEGLDELPNKGAAGEIMIDLMEHALVSEEMKLSPEWQEKKEKEELEKKEEQKAKEQQKEDIKILQGKLLMLKRFLIEESLLNDANKQITGGS